MSFFEKAQKVARNPALRPLEIWLIRAALVALAGWLGLDLSHLL